MNVLELVFALCPYRSDDDDKWKEMKKDLAEHVEAL